MLERIIAAGQGGQGLMFTGKLIAWAMMVKGYRVTYIPSYGAEVRGGTANCHVIASSGRIHSPIVEEADTLIIMNTLSLKRFSDLLVEGGILFVNTSMVDSDQIPAGARTVAVPATEVAAELGDVRVANMVMFGAYNAVRGSMSAEAIREAMDKATGGRKKDMTALNLAAVVRGSSCVGQTA